MNFTKGEEVTHTRYGVATVEEIFDNIPDNKPGVLLELHSVEGVKLLNSDRQIKQMPKTIELTRCFEDDLTLIN